MFSSRDFSFFQSSGVNFQIIISLSSGLNLYKLSHKTLNLSQGRIELAVS
ncbi:MAG: hypothetical protein LBQ24_05710 [Candidatus Peribacteria bacterium]|nr:hypothetical protein [Candidatus Peribacteria bacterium]